MRLSPNNIQNILQQTRSTDNQVEVKFTIGREVLRTPILQFHLSLPFLGNDPKKLDLSTRLFLASTHGLGMRLTIQATAFLSCTIACHSYVISTIFIQMTKRWTEEVGHRLVHHADCFSPGGTHGHNLRLKPSRPGFVMHDSLPFIRNIQEPKGWTEEVGHV